MAPEEPCAREQHALLCGGREPVRLSGKDLDLVPHVMKIENALQFVSFADRHDAVLVAVQHEYGRSRRGESAFHAGWQTARELNDGADTTILRGQSHG